MKRGSSASMGSGSHRSGAASMSSCHQWSRPGVQGTSSPVRRTTTTCSTLVASFRASSAFCLRGTIPPRRKPPSAVMRTLASASLIRSASAPAEKPPKTTEWTAPIRVQASMAMAASGIMGR